METSAEKAKLMTNNARDREQGKGVAAGNACFKYLGATVSHESTK